MSATDGDNLLLALHKWAHGQSENFTSEAFAALLRHFLLHEKPVAKGLLDLFMPVGMAFPRAEIDLDAVSVRTQVNTKWGCPDIGIEAAGLLMFVEVKLGAVEGDEQLLRYRKALDEAPHDSRCLVFLTQHHVLTDTEPDVRLRWYQIGDFLRDAVERADWRDPTSGHLAGQFLRFMEGVGMTMDRANWTLPDGVQAMRNLLQMIGKGMEGRFKKQERSPAWDWMGYGHERGFLGIRLEEPAVLHFEVQLPDADPPALASLGFGEVGDGRYPRKKVWYCSLDLASEEVHFFARSQASQMQVVEEFVKRSHDAMRALFPEDPDDS